MNATAAETTTAIERELHIAAAPETVWELLADPRQMIRWMGQAAAFDLRRGGQYEIDVVPGRTAAGEFVEIDPPRRLVYTWGWKMDGTLVPPGSTTIIFELLPREGGTLLRFTHRDLPTAESVTSHTQGWEHYFERLAVVAAGGDPGADPWVTERS